MEMALAIIGTALAAWDIGRRWIGSAQRLKGLEARLDDIESTGREKRDAIAKGINALQDRVLRIEDEDVHPQVTANLASIEVLSAAVKRMNSDHQAITALGQTAMQRRQGMKG